MKKIYSGIAALLVAGLVYGASDKKGETLKYSVVFNSGSIESKIVGKHYNEITKRYLPPTEVTQGRKRGTFTAKYDRLRVFTKGDSHVINGMTVNGSPDSYGGVTYDKRYRHLENLVKLVFFISIPWEDFMADYRPLLRTIAGRLGVSSNELERMIGRCSPSDPDDPESRSIHIEVVVPWGYLKKEYADDFVRIIACRDTMLTPSAIDFLFDVMDSYGLSRSDFLARVNEIGRREFGGRQIRACELADLKGWYDVRKS